MPIIEVNHVIKEYQLGTMQSLKSHALNQWRRLTGQPSEERAPFKALDDVHFSIEPGEVVGIIGHNGAGKSTMLKLLANIAKPSSGSITVKGKIAPLIEVGAGLVGDLTGRENIYLNGAILGISKSEINSKFDEIVAFAELEEFIDTPIKRYSSGMQVRLGFSIATSVESDILIVDEVLAVGDLAFQRKCFDRMEDLIKRQGKTVLIVSHNIRQLERLCSRVIMLDHGQIVADGDPTEVSNLFFDYSNKKIKSDALNSHSGKSRTSDELTFKTIEFYDEHCHSVDSINFFSPFRIRVQFTINKPLERICFLIGAHTTDFVYLTANNNVEDPRNFEIGEHAVELHFESMTLLPGVYSMRAWIGTPEGRESFYGENLFSFQVYSDDHLITRQQEMGLFYMKSRFEIDSSLANATPTIGQH
ncbi:Teichoic acid export ATP-binding protein TagH [Candidatus Nitrotoga sp. BS]|uniref:ABC transporter ATP-binding protein n=1 Tax=Candidatus Nitrotoga sp. BS TaxID=2890408 RepID=UPI001EF2D095|nr:ABC transporter ATP-binding protein [Candidatus Nitrotoga sp. BS]CAH1202364.1 Teichoic acid export ATP-binding protein TagH [Candidatus Nitrotoga sp. BS]